MRILFLLLLLAELVSYASSFFLALNTVGFFVIVAAALVLSLRRLEYGLYFVLADLILGGKSGALFSFDYGGFFLSLRMALFIVVMGVWMGKVTGNFISRHPDPEPREGEGSRAINNGIPRLATLARNDILKWWVVFGLAVVWEIIVGLARGNDFGNLFLDANGYFYAAMVLPFVWAFGRRHSEHSEESHTMDRARGEILRFAQDDIVWRVFFVATTLLAFKTLFAVYIFTHAGNNSIAANLIPFYRWVRDTGVGEITWLPGNFARVFFQSQIYSVVAFFAALAMLAHNANRRESRGEYMRMFGFLVLNAAVILASLSRSFWVGVVVGLVVLTLALIKFRNPSQPPLNLRGGVLAVLGGFLGAVVILFAVARFPLPRPSAMDFSLVAQSRITFEPAAASRWNLLPEMWKAVREHPILGSGFGRTITYISNDPRIREVNPTGEYTTYAFEWGWLDFWLKLGLIGLIGPIGLIIALARTLYKKARLAGLPSTELALVLGLAVVATIHIFTPYLNHPLGIGILILATLYAQQPKSGQTN